MLKSQVLLYNILYKYFFECNPTLVPNRHLKLYFIFVLNFRNKITSILLLRCRAFLHN